MTIAQILSISFNAVKNDMLGWPTQKTWVTEELECVYKHAPNSVELCSLGAIMMTPEGVYYPVEEQYVTLCWTDADDTRPEHEQILLVKKLIENGLYSADDCLVALLDEGYKLYVSSTYRYSLGQATQILNGGFAKIYTAYAKVPRS